MVPAKQSFCAFRQLSLLVKLSILPHHLPLEASQVDVGVGAGVEDLLVVVGVLEVETSVVVVVRVDVEIEVETDVEEDVRVEDGRVEDVVEVDSLKLRYQFERSVSPRHSPTVTPFHPFC
jgi:hypothetical protein